MKPARISMTKWMPVVSEGEGVRIKMLVSGENKLFTDLKNKKILEQRDFMNRIFLVEDELKEGGWKMTGNQKIILDYPCMEAVKTDTAGVMTSVWFAPSFKIQGGPAKFSNLPGMVLEVNIKDGSHTYIAKSIEPVSIKDLKILKPRDGKRVTEAEYRKIMADKMKEMGIDDANGGDGTHMRIIIKQ